MARPVGANATETKERVLLSAAALFASQGEGNTSMRQIAGASGVSLGTVHHYFGSKAHLYHACIDAMYQDMAKLRESLLGQIEPDLDMAMVVPDVVRRAFHFAYERQSALRLIMRDVVDEGELRP